MADDIPWLAKRGDTYYVWWYDKKPNGKRGRTKRVSLGTSDSVEAQKSYAAFLAEGHAAFETGARQVTVSHALDDYWRDHVAAKVVDKARQEDAIAHLKAYFKNKPITEVDVAASRNYTEARMDGKVDGSRRRWGRKVAGATVRRELVVLQAAANLEAKFRRIGPNAKPPTAMPSIELPQASPKRDDVWLTKEELAMAIARAEGPLRDFITIAYYTGARRASVLGLTRFQVNLKTNRLDLTGPNETANQRRSKKRRPVVPIDPKLRPTLERMLAETKTEYLFGKPIDIYRRFHAHMVSLGLATKARPHCLRHSRATHLLQDGVNIYDVARLLGDTVATVERTYGHHSSDYLATAIGAVG